MNKTGTHLRGDIAELAIATHLMKLGYKISIPYGHDHSYDLVVDRGNQLERIQVKCVCSSEELISIPGRSIGRVRGKALRTNYCANNVDWLAVYDERQCKCYFIPASVLGDAGKDYWQLRLAPTKNNQTKHVLWAVDFEEFGAPARN